MTLTLLLDLDDTLLGNHLNTLRHPFARMNTYTTAHFTKPNPAYYAEFLAQLGWQEGAVVMVGNDYQADILPARRLGLPAYWVTESAPQTPADPQIGWGPLENLIPWVDAQPEGTLNPRFATPEALQAILRANPAAAASLLARIPPENLCRRPAPDVWAVCEILCHLRDVEREVNLPRLQAILNDENPFIPLVNSDPWAETRNYICQNPAQALQDYCTARLELLNLLENLAPQDWQRPARHAIFGPTTLFETIEFLTRHDQLHLRQLFQAA